MKKKLFLIFLVVISVFLPVGSTSALTTTELYNNAANNIFFYVKGDDACNPSTLAEYVATITGDQITWIGDYYSVLARGIIETRYPGVSIFAEGGRNFSETGGVESGIDVAKRLAENNALRKNVVFMLGGNGGANKTEEEVSSMISELLSAIGEDRRVVLMTVRTNVLNYDNFNKVVKESADNERVLVADFAEAIKDNTSDYFEEGKNYLNEKGLNLLVATVVATLDKFTNDLKSKATSTVGATLGAIGSPTTSGDTSSVEGRVRMIAEYLIGSGYDLNATAGILGNLMGENSTFDPTKIENNLYRNGPCSGGFASSSNWRITNTSDWRGYPGHCGFGIVQWTSADRQEGLQDFADRGGWSVTSLETQIGYLMEELKSASYKCTSENLNNKSLEEATFYVLRDYETPSGFTRFETSFESAQGTESFKKRFGYAQKWKQFIEENNIAGITWSGGGSSGALCSTNAQGATGLAMLARQMSWPNDNGTCLTNTGAVRQWRDKACYPNPRDKYKQVVEELKTKGIKIPKFMDCSYFIAAVIRYSGLDDNWPAPGGSEPAWRYANSEKGQQLWAKIENLGNTSNLMPGDVFTYPRANGRAGHVMMYIGEYGGRFGNMAGASLDTNVAIVGKIYFTHADNGSGAGTKFTISRYKGSATVDLGTSTDGEWGEEYGEEGEDEEETETTSVKNSCGTSKVSQGKVYKDEMSSSQIDLFARVIDSTGCKSLGGCKAAGSFILIKYEREKSSGKEKASLASYLSSKYPQYTNTSNSATSFAKSAAKALIESGDRTLPANTVEMLAPKKVSVIKIDGTDATRRKINVESDLDGLIPGTSIGIINGYGKEGLRFFCAAKDSSGNYIHLFWQKDNTPSGQETK